MTDQTLFKVPYTKVRDVRTHANAERLDIVKIYGFDVIVKRDSLKVGDPVIYTPIDSILPNWLNDRLFPVDSKVKLHNNRIRQIRLRGLASQGMLINVNDVKDKIPSYLEDEMDLSTYLEIVKYQPPFSGFSQEHQSKVGRSRDRREDHPLFHSYNGLNALKWFPDLFRQDEEVHISEKLHGTSARMSNLPFVPDTLWKKILKLLKFNPKQEINYGSNNVQISKRSNYKGFYGSDLYGEAFKYCDAVNKIKENEIIYGEIIGEGIQKNYTYGHKKPHFVLFDVKIYNPEDSTFKWLSPIEVELYAIEREFDVVPTLFKGFFRDVNLKKLASGPSIYESKQNTIEGVVIKSIDNYNDEYCHSGRRSLKLINEEYLDDKTNTDNH